MAPEASARDARVVILAGPGDSTSIVFHRLRAHFPEVVVVQEQPQSRLELARRRAQRLGWATVAGQVLFVALIMPVLRWRGRSRIAQIVAQFELDPTPIDGAHPVSSVNAPETRALVQSLAPDIVVVNGTRIISAAALGSMPCPVVNLHAGITPQYRGVHGGYWALADGRPELVGTTIHLVDTGIDTGHVLAQATFDPGPADSIATFPYLHLACGLPLLVEVVERMTGGAGPPRPATSQLPPDAAGAGAPGTSRLHWHPTAWGYLWRRVTSGVR